MVGEDELFEGGRDELVLRVPVFLAGIDVLEFEPQVARAQTLNEASQTQALHDAVALVRWRQLQLQSCLTAAASSSKPVMYSLG